MNLAARIRSDQSYDVFVGNRVQVVVEAPGDGSGFTYWARRVTGDVVSEGWEKPETTIERMDDAARFLVLDCPDFVARAVYEALRDRYEPELADVNRLTRADLERERNRVDTLLDVVSRVALDGVG